MDKLNWLLPILPAIRVLLFCTSGALLSTALILFLTQGSDISGSMDSVSQGGQSRDKRRTPRHASEATFEFIDEALSPEPAAAGIINLSNGGACLLSARRLSTGRHFLGRLRIASQSAMRVSASVMWQKPMKGMMLYGVRFDRMQPDL